MADPELLAQHHGKGKKNTDPKPGIQGSAKLPSKIDAEVEGAVDKFRTAFSNSSAINTADPQIDRFRKDEAFREKVVSRFNQKFQTDFEKAQRSHLYNLEQKVKESLEISPERAANILGLTRPTSGLEYIGSAIARFLTDKKTLLSVEENSKAVIDNCAKDDKYYNSVKQAYKSKTGRELDSDFGAALKESRERLKKEHEERKKIRPKLVVG